MADNFLERQRIEYEERKKAHKGKKTKGSKKGEVELSESLKRMREEIRREHL